MLSRRAVAVVAAVVVATGCGSPQRRSPVAAGALTVATTVAPVSDIVEQVVGDRARVVELIPAGVDSHTFEPSPSTARALSGADVLFLAGLHLEDSTLEQARANMGHGSSTVALGDRTLPRSDYAFDATFPEARGAPNPHVWMDPVYAGRWAEIVRDTMVGRDPRNAGYYRANAARFLATVDRLDSAIRSSIESIPPAHRKLLTYHDSFAYFARRYGIPVIGAVQPSDFAEPSPKEVQALVEQVKAAGVPAVFGSEVFPSTVLAQVAEQSGARFIDALRDDQLPGAPGEPRHSYVGMMVDDVTVITRSLGGDPAALDSVPTAASYSR